MRECGPNFLLTNDAANVLFPTAMCAQAENLLGHQIMGEPIKHDGIHIRFTAFEPNKGIAQAVELGDAATEVPKGDLATEIFGAIVTKETCCFDHELLTHIYAAKNGCATDAQLGAIAGAVQRAFDVLAQRAAQLKEKSFWEGVMGQMNVDTADPGAGPITINTGTTVLPSLTGTDVWTDEVNSTPLQDIDDARLSFRGTCFTPCEMVMNQETYTKFVQADSVREELGECLRSCLVMGTDIPKVRGMGVRVYDAGYTDATGVWTPYVPDGVVVYRGCNGTTTGVNCYDCLNVDDCTGQTYGSHVELLTESNPKTQCVYHSWVGAPVFTSPQAFASQQVFTA